MCIISNYSMCRLHINIYAVAHKDIHYVRISIQIKDVTHLYMVIFLWKESRSKTGEREETSGNSKRVQNNKVKY